MLRGLRTLTSQYDAFLVDLYGVIHNGGPPFDGAVDALRELAAAGRRVVFLSNTSRLGAAVAESLAGIGIDPELYEAVISSGDVTRDAILSRDGGLFDLLPEHPRCIHLGDPSFVPWLFDLGLTFDDANEDTVPTADLVIASGAPGDDAALAHVQQQLVPAAARGIPLVCTNPDRVIPTSTGLTLGPGAVAAAYADLGGRVFLYGKPHAPIYAAARKLLGDDWQSERIVAMGDLLDTDIRGARAIGIASVLVTGTGGHAAALGPAPTPTALDALFASTGIAPDMILSRFAW